MFNFPNDRRNRIGCFAILLILVLFIALYLLVGTSAPPGNSLMEDIHTLPVR